MGTSCSSIKKKNRQKSSLEDDQPFDDGRRCSNRSVESLPYGAKSLTVNAPKEYFKTTLTETGEEASSSDQILSPVQSSSQLVKDDNHLTALSITPSPLPSSQTPSPHTTPSASKHISLASGLPNLDQYSTHVNNLLTGQKLDHIPQFPLTKEFCIYLITNNLDAHHLSIYKVIPDLKKLFSQKGYEINLYNFNSDSLKYVDDSCLKDLCLNSLRSLKDRARLIPLIILEDNYSPKILPKKIIEKDFNEIINSLHSEECKQLFKKWYLKDENSLIPVFVLQSISTHHSSFKSSSIKDKANALQEWEKESNRMLSEFENSFKNESLWDSYLTSIFDEELKFLDSSGCDLSKQTILAHQDQLDKVAATTKKLINKLAESILSNHKLILPSSESKEVNQDNLCKFVINILKKLLEVCLEEDVQADLIKHCSQIGFHLYFELVHQANHRNELVQNFAGRTSYLNSIQSYLFSSANTLLIITGSKGVGKSALLAQVSIKSTEWFPSSFIIYRSIGISVESFTSEEVFRSICEQCCLLYGEHVNSASHVIVNGKDVLQKILSKVIQERSLIIIIDGLDHAADFSLLNLDDCFPQELSPFVKVVLSTNYGPVLENLKTIWNSDCFLNLEEINSSESFEILENILKQSKRTISSNQKECLTNHFANLSLTPLLAHLVGHEACNWSSNYAISLNLNFSNFEGFILSMFESLSDILGSNLFITILTLISSTEYGISDQEVLNIINQDTSFFSSHPTSRFEYSFWTFIKLKLSPLISFNLVNGLFLYHFSNQQVKELAKKYVQSKANQFSTSLSILLNYFKLNENEYKSLQSRPDPLTNQWPNRRKAQELVYLLVQHSTQQINYLNDYFLNLKWICFKLSKCDSYQLLEDIQLFVTSNLSKSYSKEDLEALDIFTQLVKSSAYPLRCEGLSVLSQLYFRLSSLLNHDSSLHISKLGKLLKETSRPFVSSLLPLYPHHLPQIRDDILKDPPVDKVNHDINMFFTIKGDENHIISLSTGKGEICVYNIYNPEPIRRLTGIVQPKDLKMIDKFRAVVLCNRDLKIYDLNQGKLESKLKGVMNQKMPFFGLHDENYLVALSRNRMYVNMQSLKTGDLETTFKVGEDRFLNSLLVSANGTICVCGDETQKPFPLLVWDLSNRKLIYDLRIPHHEFITRLSAISDDGHYVVSICKELNTSSPNFIIVYDLQSGTLFKKWKPNSDTISIAISSQSSCVVNCIETSLILVWDLVTGAKRLTLYGHSSPVDKLQFSENGQILLSYDSTKKDRSMRLWNLNSGACIAVFTPDKPLSCCQLSPNGKVVVMSLTDSSNVHTLILCHNTSIDDELKNVTNNVYGDKDKEGQTFDLIKDN